MSEKRSSVYGDITNALLRADIRHFAAEFPLTVGYATGIFCTANLHHFCFHPYGLSYLSYHTKGSAALYQKLHNEAEYEKLCEAINADWKGRGSRDQLIFALYNGSDLVGVMANYKPIPNSDIMQRIADLDLDRYLTGFSLSPIAFRVFLNVGIGAKHLVTLSIKNGHSGHVAFSYNARFSTDSYEYEVPLSDNVRHLSRAALAVTNLEEIMKTAKEMEMDARLEATPVAACYEWIDMKYPIMTPSQERLLEELRKQRPADGLQFVVMAASYISTRGLKGAVRSFNDTVMEKVFGK